MIAIGLLLERPRVGPEGHSGADLGQLWATAYEHAVASGFGTTQCCQSDTDVARRCEELCGVRLQFADADDVTMLGCYCGLSTGGCLGLLLEVAGAPVAVFVLPTTNDPRPDLPNGALELHRRELGNVALYAISQQEADAEPVAVPTALSQFSL